MESFTSEFTTGLPTMRIYSARDLVENMQKVAEIVNDEKKDWNTRANAVSCC